MGQKHIASAEHCIGGVTHGAPKGAPSTSHFSHAVSISGFGFLTLKKCETFTSIISTLKPEKNM